MNNSAATSHDYYLPDKRAARVVLPRGGAHRISIGLEEREETLREKMKLERTIARRVIRYANLRAGIAHGVTTRLLAENDRLQDRVASLEQRVTALEARK